MKKNAEKRVFRIGDLIAVLAVLLLAALVFLFALGKKEGAYAKITTYDGEVILLPLNEDCEKTVVSRGYTLLVVVENGAVSVKGADCPDRICVHSGALSKVGKTIVCAPAGVVICVVGGGESDADFVAG